MHTQFNHAGIQLIKRFKRLCRMPRPSGWWSAAMLVVALLATGCRTSDRTTSRSASGLLEWNRKMNVALATIPSSLAEITVPVDSLRKLPVGAAFTNRSRQATAVLTLRGDTLLVYAQCDSLQTLTYELEEQLRQAHDELEEQQTLKTPAVSSFWVKLTWYAAGVLTGVFILLLIHLRNLL